MTIDLSTSHDFQLFLEPMDSCESYPSVLLKVQAKVNMPSWQATVESTGSWFLHESLNAFERSLKALEASVDGIAALYDMDEFPAILITRSGNEICVRITVNDSINMGSSSVEVNGNASEISTLSERLKNYPKWW